MNLKVLKPSRQNRITPLRQNGMTIAIVSSKLCLEKERMTPTTLIMMRWKKCQTYKRHIFYWIRQSKNLLEESGILLWLKPGHWVRSESWPEKSFLCVFLECLGALKISLTSSGEENLTAFFTKRLHDLENKRDQYMHAKGKMKEDFKQFSPTKVSFFFIETLEK